ncbi:MAG TPA: helix-turn-helix domain-containing protein [Pseudolabrys sp.]|jgi:AcrR family transcriptional regulator
MARRRNVKTKRVAPRTQEQRRTDTRNAVLKAAMTVLVEDGYEKFTTTRVAKAAGVSRGAQENYFRTKNELIVAATRYTLMRAADEARVLAARNAGSADPVEAFLENSEAFYLGPTYLALMEMVAVSRRDPALSKLNTPVVRQFRNAVDDVWIDALCSAGYAREGVRSFVKITHYILRGMALASVFQPRRSEFPALLDEWRLMAQRELKRMNK